MLNKGQYWGIWHILPVKAGDPGRSGRDSPKFVGGALRIVRTGSAWRDPPGCLGSLSSEFVRFARWSRSGKKGGCASPGRPRGGLITKVHALVQGMGQLFGVAITGGKVADFTEAQGLLRGLEPAEVVVDKG